MKEVILGLGHRESLWQIVQIADDQLRAVHGSPKKMVVRSGGLVIDAHRPQFEGPFNSFVVRFSGPYAESPQSIHAIVDQQQIECQVVEEDGTIEGPFGAQRKQSG